MISDFVIDVYGFVVDITPGSFWEVVTYPVFDFIITTLRDMGW